MKILFSLPYSKTFAVESQTVDGHTILAEARTSDWGLRGLRKRLHHLKEAVKLSWRARQVDALVMCTVSIEAFIIALFRGLLCRRTKLVCFDFLIPHQGLLNRLLAFWLRKIEAFVVIRRGDTETLHRRFGVLRDRCHFSPFPAPEVGLDELEIADDDYVYSAGWAHRDWPTLIEALAALPAKAIISAGRPLDIPPEAAGRISLLPMQPPQAGRALAARAGIVVISMQETELPSGPLVLLDAMAMGKAVVVSNVNGTRDYVQGTDVGLLVAPGDVGAMRRALQTLLEDRELRARLGANARRHVQANFSLKQCVKSIVAICAGERPSMPVASAAT